MMALLLDKLDTHGSEDFKIDKENEFNNQWGALLKARGGILQECKQGAAEGFVSTRKSFRKLRICFLFDYFLDADDADWNIKKIRVHLRHLCLKSKSPIFLRLHGTSHIIGTVTLTGCH